MDVLVVAGVVVVVGNLRACQLSSVCAIVQCVCHPVCIYTVPG